MTNPTNEELALLYHGMSSEQLMQAAMEYETLTDTAKSAIRAEFAVRRLEPPELPDPIPTSKAEELVIVGRYRDLPQGQMARTVLESAAIPCFLRDENTVRNDWLLSNLMGGMRLMVNASDREAAEALLAEPVPGAILEDDAGD